MSVKSLGTLPATIALLSALILGPARAAESYPGYTLFSTGTTAYLCNSNKEVLHQWSVAAGRNVSCGLSNGANSTLDECLTQLQPLLGDNKVTGLPKSKHDVDTLCASVAISSQAKKFSRSSLRAHNF